MGTGFDRALVFFFFFLLKGKGERSFPANENFFIQIGDEPVATMYIVQNW